MVRPPSTKIVRPYNFDRRTGSLLTPSAMAGSAASYPMIKSGMKVMSPGKMQRITIKIA